MTRKRKNCTEYADHSFSLRRGQHHNFLNFEDLEDNDNAILFAAHFEMLDKFIDFCKRKKGKYAQERPDKNKDKLYEENQEPSVPFREIPQSATCRLTVAGMPDTPPQLPPPPAATTITALSDDILCEIFLRLPNIMSLSRAAFACCAFLHAIRSSPVFRRRFRELRAPPLLALFLPPYKRTIIPAAASKSRDIAAAFEDLVRDFDSSEPTWRIDTEVCYVHGYANFFNPATNQCADYNPYSRALNIYPLPSDVNNSFLEFHTLSPDGEEQRPSRVVCVHRERAWAWARVALFSSDTMEWQVVLLDMDTGGLLVDYDRQATGTVVNGFVCWVHDGEGCILALNTVTFQFSRMDLPPPLKVPVPESMFQLGHTKDGKFCVVSVLQCMLSVWLWAADSDGVERFMLHKTFSLRSNVSEITECSDNSDVQMRPMAVINGFVYLSLIIDYFRYPRSPEWFLSFCLETDEVNLLHKESNAIGCYVDPYIMVSWPLSLIHGKDSKTRVTGNISEDDGPMFTEETSPVLFTALQSFKEKLIDDDKSKFAEIESFLLDDERNSLMNRITTLESGLAAARDRVLRIRTEPNSMSGMEIVTSESELAAARDCVLRTGTESDSMEGTGRVSCWQMCKVMLGRVCSRFFTR